MRLLLGFFLTVVGCAPTAQPHTVRPRTDHAAGAGAGPGTATSGDCGESLALADAAVVDEDFERAFVRRLRDLNETMPQGVVALEMGRETRRRGLRVDVGFFADGVPLCRSASRLHVTRHDGETRVVLSSPPPAALLRLDRVELIEDGATDGARTERATRCFAIEAGRAALRWTAPEPGGYHFAAEAQIAVPGRETATLKTIRLEGLSSASRLRSPRFETVLADGSEPARSTAGRFAFGLGDRRTDEVTAFANAVKAMDWLQRSEHDYDPGCAKVQINLHASADSPVGPIKDNARYLPAADGLPARIELGDGLDLRNLATDFDIIAHELGHHVLYRRLTAKSGEARGIHEGLADFLVYAQTGNACLGEAVTEAACMRSAANDLHLSDEDARGAYGQAEVLSGLLWDLARQEKDLGLSGVARLVFASVDYLSADSGFRDLFAGLMEADAELHDGANACAVQSLALARGFDEALDGVACETSVRSR